MVSLVERLEWDSSFFGIGVARIDSNHLDTESLRSILAWCNVQNIRCLYFLAAADDDATVRLAEANGFHLVDIRLTLESKPVVEGAHVWNTGSGRILRPAQAVDLPLLREIARTSHRDTRFYFDGNFPTAQCDALYEAWIERSYAGYAEMVIVAELEGQAAGYISCHLPSTQVGKIGLLGVGSAAQGRGLGQHLVSAALAWFVKQGAAQVTVVTQGRNIPAQRLYQKCGFRTQAMQLWYHRWFDQL